MVLTNDKLLLKPKFDDEKIGGIIKKIEKGLAIPPVKYIKQLNCKISINKKKDAVLSDSWVLLLIKTKYKLLNTPSKIIKFVNVKFKSKFKI